MPSASVRAPQDSVGSVPGGDSVGSVPGGDLACGYSLSSASANCSIAINVNVPPISDATTPSNLLPGLHPADLQNAYALPSQSGGGTVAIVDAYDDPQAESDLGVYRTAYGLPPCTSSNGCFSKVNQTGTAGSYPLPNAGWDNEISIDLDVVSAVCPNCKILLVEANSNLLSDLGAAVDTAAKLGAVAISNSYYAAEWSGETAYDAYYHHPGIAITVSSGDNAKPYYPSTSPYVTSVGGTSLSSSAGSWSESPWAYGGRGCSRYESKPLWQGSNGCQGKRSANDVSAVADPQTGVSMYDSTAGGWLVAGGTSVGAPLIAAAYALSGNPQGPAYSYGHRSAFHDVAPAGYDWATGLGTPNGVGGL
jgi:subtilase family serine protease